MTRHFHHRSTAHLSLNSNSALQVVMTTFYCAAAIPAVLLQKGCNVCGMFACSKLNLSNSLGLLEFVFDYLYLVWDLSAMIRR